MARQQEMWIKFFTRKHDGTQLRSDIRGTGEGDFIQAGDASTRFSLCKGLTWLFLAKGFENLDELSWRDLNGEKRKDVS